MHVKLYFCARWFPSFPSSALVSILMLASLAGRPATRPTSGPTDGTTMQDAATAGVATATAALNAAKARAISSVAQTPEYKVATVKADELLSKLQEARRFGTPQQRIAASSAYEKAIAVVREMENQAVAHDPATQAAAARLRDLQSADAEVARRASQEKKAAERLAVIRDDLRAKTEEDEGITSKYDRIKDQSTIGCKVQIPGPLPGRDHFLGVICYFPGETLKPETTSFGIVLVEYSDVTIAHLGDRMLLWMLVDGKERKRFELICRHVEIAPSGLHLQMLSAKVPTADVSPLLSATSIEGELPDGKTFTLTERQVRMLRELGRQTGFTQG